MTITQKWFSIKGLKHPEMKRIFFTLFIDPKPKDKKIFHLLPHIKKTVELTRLNRWTKNVFVKVSQ